MSKARQKAKQYLPEKSSPQYNRFQGWNKERKQFLVDQGYSEKDVDTLSSLIDWHVQSAHSADEKMQAFAAGHRDMLLDVAAFESEAAEVRKQMDIDRIDEDIQRLEESKGDVSLFVSDPKDIRDMQEAIDEKIAYKREQQERMKAAPVTLYRKGDYDSTVLSFTTDPSGAVLHEGTEHEVQLTPDHKDTLDDLIDQGIVPVSGLGAFNNFYGEGEVTCVKLSDSSNESNGKEGNQASGENNKERHESGNGGGGTNFQSAGEFRGYLMGSPKENVSATRAHIKDDAWMRQRDQAIANGVLPKSGFDRSERVVRDVVKNLLKSGEFTEVKSRKGDYRAILIEPRLQGTGFRYDPEGGIKPCKTTKVGLSCSKDKGYHVYPLVEGDD